jgi:NAD(P)-dependent dehydrogenase (short-subunit alcohol dehydrogenase family)
MTQRTWFITGASRGIGAEIALAVLAAGDQLIATARNKTDLHQFESSQNVLTLSLDITDEAQVKAAVAAGLKRFGQIDVLVNNAGLGVSRDTCKLGHDVKLCTADFKNLWYPVVSIQSSDFL